MSLKKLKFIYSARGLIFPQAKPNKWGQFYTLVCVSLGVIAKTPCASARLLIKSFGK
jgi:hypothetical protein